MTSRPFVTHLDRRDVYISCRRIVFGFLISVSIITASTLTPMAFAESAESELAIGDYAVFSVLYSASRGRAMAGMVDRFGTARFADCEAPRGAFTSVIEITSLTHCQTVPGSLFVLNAANLVRIQRQLPGRLATSFVEAIDPTFAKAQASLRAKMWTGATFVSIASALFFNWKSVARSQSIVRGVLMGSLKGQVALIAALGSLFALGNELNRYAYVGHFHALEGLLQSPLGTVLIFPGSDAAIPVNEKTLPHIYDVLRRAILHSLDTLPSV